MTVSGTHPVGLPLMIAGGFLYRWPMWIVVADLLALYGRPSLSTKALGFDCMGQNSDSVSVSAVPCSATHARLLFKYR